MKKNIILWLGAIIITFLSGYLRNVIGPDYPVSGTIGFEGKMVTFKFDKIYRGNNSYNVFIRSDVKAVKAFLLWKDFSTNAFTGLHPKNQFVSTWHREIMSDSG